jgi:hypothetical protein
LLLVVIGFDVQNLLENGLDVVVLDEAPEDLSAVHAEKPL